MDVKSKLKEVVGRGLEEMMMVPYATEQELKEQFRAYMQTAAGKGLAFHCKICTSCNTLGEHISKCL